MITIYEMSSSDVIKQDAQEDKNTYEVRNQQVDLRLQTYQEAEYYKKQEMPVDMAGIDIEVFMQNQQK